MAVDISKKAVLERIATAEGLLTISKGTLSRIQNKEVEKGDVFENARLAAIHAVKQTPQMVFMCHPIPIYHVKVDFEEINHINSNQGQIKIKVLVKTSSKTGCEIEALAGVLNGLLGIWDLVKMYEKDPTGNYPDTYITNVRVISKIKNMAKGMNKI
ncbi:MAG: cyclic pyranopterin monophosphate synthase MoaC [Candidatus Hodarchaeales archaeon]